MKIFFEFLYPYYFSFCLSRGDSEAGSIYDPSHISFEFALSYYGLIPEAVYTVTSATFEKRKRKNLKRFSGPLLTAMCLRKLFHWN